MAKGKITQYFSDKERSIKEFPITLTKAVYDKNGDRLDDKLKNIDNRIEEIKKSVSKSTKLVADALTAQGVATDENATFKDLLLTAPPRDITAISEVPPPISTIILP